jgi:hypothetical protein
VQEVLGQSGERRAGHGFWPGMLVFALYTCLAVIWLSPLSLHLASHVYDPGDTFLNIWALAWDWHALTTDPLNLFNANIFWPAPNSLAFSEHLIVQAVMAAPVLALTGNPILAHNLVLLLSFPLSGLGVYLLVKRLTGNFWAALLAGFFFAFCPFHLMQVTRLQMASIQWLPFTFLFLHRWLDSRSWPDIMGLAFFYILQCLSCGYYALFLTVLLGLALLAGLAGGRRWASGRVWLQLGAFGLVSLVLLLHFFYPYVVVKAQHGFYRDLGEVRHYSASLRSYLAATGQNALYGPWLYHLGREEGHLFPGLAAPLLAVLGLLLYRRRPGQGFAAGQEPGRRWLYCGLAIAAFLLALGPEITLGGKVLVSGPHRLLYEYFPGFSGLRTAARWGMMLMFFLAVLAGYGLAGLMGRISRRGLRAALVLAFAAVLALELYPVPLRAHGPHPRPAAMPGFITWLAKQPGPGAVLFIPLGNPSQDAFHTFIAAYHLKPQINGYSGYFPAGHVALGGLLRRPPSRALVADLARAGVRWIMVAPRHVKQPGLGKATLAALKNMPGLVTPGPQWKWGGGMYAFVLGPPPPAKLLRATAPGGARATASVRNDLAALAIDGDPATVWYTHRPQEAGDWFQVILQGPTQIRGLELDLGANPEFLPRGLKLSLLGSDGQWRAAPDAQATLRPLKQILAAPRQTRARYVLTLPQVREVKGLRLEAGQADPAQGWNIHEFRLIPPG